MPPDPRAGNQPHHSPPTGHHRARQRRRAHPPPHPRHRGGPPIKTPARPSVGGCPPLPPATPAPTPPSLAPRTRSVEPAISGMTGSCALVTGSGVGTVAGSTPATVRTVQNLTMISTKPQLRGRRNMFLTTVARHRTPVTVGIPHSFHSRANVNEPTPARIRGNSRRI